MQHGEARSPLRRAPSHCCASRAGDEPKAMMQPVDLESGRGHGEVTRTTSMSKLDDTMTDAETAAMIESMVERAVASVVTSAVRVLKCIVRGVLIVLWICMIDFIRRIVSLGDQVLVVMILFHVIPVVFIISICFCCASEMLEAYVPTRAHVDFEQQ